MKRQIGICDNIVVVMDVYKSDYREQYQCRHRQCDCNEFDAQFLSIFVLQSIADITHGFYCHAELKQLQLFSQV